MIRLTASQAAASAAWGQTWEIKIPVCSAIDSAEVNLVWRRELELKLLCLEKSLNFAVLAFIVTTRSPAAAWLHSSQEGAKAAEAMAKVAASNRTWGTDFL